MSSADPALVAVLLLAGLGLLLGLSTAWTLSRLRRSEARVARAWMVLDVQLKRRASLVEDLARRFPAALGEDRAARIAGAAVAARMAHPDDRDQAEGALGRELRGLPPDLPGAPAPLGMDLAGTGVRVALARRFYNDAVRDLRALRRTPLSRVLRLRAAQPVPRFFGTDEVEAVERARLAAAGALAAVEDRLGRSTDGIDVMGDEAVDPEGRLADHAGRPPRSRR